MIKSDDVFNAAVGAEGLFEVRRFVLRLAPEWHRRLEKLGAGIVSEALDPADLLANSIYLHETWHWWQHSGSTFGFLSGMVSPVQTHANTRYLKEILSSLGAIKSMHQMLLDSKDPGGIGSRFGLAHVVVNNFADFRIYQALCSHPERAKEILRSPFFEGKGHGLGITYMNIVSMLARSVDRKFETLPDPRPWDDQFQHLHRTQANQFFRNSSPLIPPVGAFHIFEGQCRYNQLLFLEQGSGGAFSWDQAEALGMFQPPYNEAFLLFLTLLDEGRPKKIDSPLVGLFLLICDLALNPTSGFPCDIDFQSDFVSAVDPGTRFVRLTQAAARQKSLVIDAIRDYSREEYSVIGELLTSKCGYAGPLVATETVTGWISTSEEVRQLADQHSSYRFGVENYPVAFLLSHFLAFCKDKCLSPEMFCWPGKYVAGNKVTDATVALFDKHGAPFIDGAEGSSIYPRLKSGLSEGAAHSAFLSFYQSILLYDLTEQWVLKPGLFNFDLSWLSHKSSQDELREFAELGFESVYGKRTGDFTIL